jgi:hypothetical protein
MVLTGEDPLLGLLVVEATTSRGVFVQEDVNAVK